MTTMKAVHINAHGGPEVVEYGDVPRPEPGPDEVLVAVRAAALNHLDLWVRAGWPALKLHFPHILGADGAGVVHGVGSSVTTLTPGDRVVINGTMSQPASLASLTGWDNRDPHGSILGEHVDGTYADFIAIPARNCLVMPPGVDYATTAAASLVYLTAWHSLVTRGQVRLGERVLVVGAGGGVNVASIQIAKLLGAEVYVVGSNAQKLERAKALGADVLIDRSQGDWGKAVFQATGKQGVDVVVDNVGAPTMAASLRALRVGGRLLTVGNTAGPKVELDNRFIFSRHLSLLGSTMGTIADFHTVMGLVFAGKLCPPIERVYPIAQARAALAQLESGDFFGKLVLHVSGD
jgi:NADPH:quinone reductase-like Zn-dependent oxidoreductase